MRPVTGSGVGKVETGDLQLLGLYPLLWATPTRPETFTVWRITAKKRMVARSSRSSRLSFNAVSMLSRTSQVGVWRFGVWSPSATTNTMLCPATSINCASSVNASIDCGMPFWFVAANAPGRSGRGSLRPSTGGYHHLAFCILIPTPAFTPPILHKSRMRRRARTDLSGGRSVMSVPTGSIDM